MSTPDPILALRPADGSAAALRDAITRTRAALDQGDADAASAKATRDSLLVDGTAAELKAADAALLATRNNAERLAAMLEQLEHRLAAADRTELLASSATLRAEIDATEAAVAAWEAATVPGMVEACREGVRLHNASIHALRAYAAVHDRISERYPDDAPTPLNPHGRRRNWIDQLDSPLGEMLG